jgi:tRNA (mo5U34)-methyltransferase
MFGAHPTVFKCDIEKWDAPMDWMKADACHHFGVLYHLKDPVDHLIKLSPLVKDALLLDTHIAVPGDELREYQSSGKTYRYRFYGEGGKKDVFAGMYDHAKWLLLDDLKGVLMDAGFRKIDLLEERRERNGPRILLLAQK